MIHKDTVGGYSGTLTDLAEEIGDLKYDALSHFLHLMSSKVERDSLADASRGRRKLATALKRTAEYLNQAGLEIGEAWRICEPYMTKEPEISYQDVEQIEPAQKTSK